MTLVNVLFYSVRFPTHPKSLSCEERDLLPLLFPREGGWGDEFSICLMKIGGFFLSFNAFK